MTDLSISNWQPSAPLTSATVAALTALARQWPRAMALALDTSTAGRDYLADFAFAMKGADLRAIPLAARAWIADNSMPPKPNDLGKLAREMTKQYFPTTHVDATTTAPTGRRQKWPGCKCFWFERKGEAGTFRQWDEDHAIAHQVPGVGCMGISEVEMDRMYAGEMKWGFIDDIDLPDWALDMMQRQRPTVRSA